MFQEKLQEAMEKLGLNQAKMSTMTGISKASISQYLSGNQVPPESKQREIALALGLKPDYFQQEQKISEILAKRGRIDELPVEVAARLMGMTRATVEKGLKQGRFPWGYAIKTSEDGIRNWRFFINAKSFAIVERIDI